MAKLTLSVNEDVVERAKRFAAAHDTSVSRLVEEYLGGLAPPLDLTGVPDHIVSLIGIVKAPPDFDYRKEYGDYLVKKYS
ncbi:MAG: hypothetical protein EBY17_26270 [Acidobacteriia bacterium]|jgi:hypothetical protein|nr:hypothetical protein [Terriglobia bacterium]